MHGDLYICFTAYHDNEQEEAGDTLVHTFIKVDWPVCQTRYFYFYGSIAGEMCVSTSAVFALHKEEFIPVIYVIDIGKYGEAEVLTGHVKIEEGDNITITRDDAHNSLIIEATPAEYVGFGDSFTTIPSLHPAYDIVYFAYDYLLCSVAYLGDNLRVHTASMPPWNAGLAHVMRFAGIRDAQATARPTTYLAMVYAQTDLHSNPISPHIAVIERNNRVYYRCGSGTNYTEVAGPAAPFFERAWIKWVRSATDVKFYRNGVLEATINTNLPSNAHGARFLFQMVGTANNPRSFYITTPRYSED
jgi:hypothetical protein